MNSKIRPTTFQDYAALIPVLERNRLITSMSREEWQHIWMGNPFRDLFHDVPIGWALESDGGKLVGTISNLHSPCYFKGQLLRAAVSSSWAVDAEYRNCSLLLAKRYFQQNNVDLLLNTSAGPVASKVYPFFARPLPCPDYNRQLVWITDYVRFAEAALRKKEIRAPTLLKYPAAMALRCLNTVRRRNNHSWREGQVLCLPEFDNRFDKFWSALAGRSTRLLTVRSCAALTWRFRPGIAQKQVFILATEEQGELTSYMVLLLRRVEDADLQEFRVVDVQVLDEHPGRLRALLLAALELSYKKDVDLVRLIGFSETKRRALGQTGYLVYKEPTWPYYYRVQNPVLEAELTRTEAWDASPFDGDNLWFLYSRNWARS